MDVACHTGVRKLRGFAYCLAVIDDDIIPILVLVFLDIFLLPRVREETQ